MDTIWIHINESLFKDVDIYINGIELKEEPTVKNINIIVNNDFYQYHCIYLNETSKYYYITY